MKKNETEAVKVAKIERNTMREKYMWAIATHPVLVALVGFWLVDRLGGAYVSSGNLYDYVQQLRAAGYSVHVPPMSDTSATVSSADMDAWIEQLRRLNPGVPFPEPRTVWDPKAGMLSTGSQIAAQAGLTAYLGSEALKGIAELVEAIK